MNTGNFSEREYDVIKLLLQGKSNKQIALTLGVSQSTVEYHLKNVYKKLQVSSRTEAVLRLGKSIGDNITSALGKSTVEMDSEPTDNGGKPISTRRIPMKSLLYIIGVRLLMAVLVFVLVSMTMPTNKANPKPITQAGVTSVTQQPTETPLPTQPLVPTSTIQTVATLTGIPSSVQDIAHFVSETYPDGTKVPLGATFTKTWELQNTGTTTWTTDHSFVMTEGSYPLGELQGFPPVINLPYEVKPNAIAEISVDITAPKTDTIYEIHYKLKNADGQFVSGDGAEVWLKVLVGNASLSSNDQQSVTAGGVTATLVNVTYTPDEVDAQTCFDLPSLDEWMPYDATINIKGQATEVTSVSYYPPVNKQDTSRYQTTHRCFIIGFPASSNSSDEMTISIGDIHVDAVQFLEQNCARAQQELAPKYPDLKFDCVPESSGDSYKLVQLPQDMSSQQARQIIIDVMNQTIYGPWIFNVTR